jgi:hypothetical protein
MLTNFTIQPGKPVSDLFLAKGITDFLQATGYVHQLPYGRNTAKPDVFIALKDGFGTCGTKHMALAQLALENGQEDILLKLGVYKMNAENTPPVGPVLHYYNLSCVPEAHNYLRYNGVVYDFTFPGKEPVFEPDLLTETDVKPRELYKDKVSFHKQMLDLWITEEEIPYTLDEIYAIREECIAALSSN